MSPSAARPLRILHCIRAPLGGILRHVLDLATAQIARGHAVGIVSDTLTGGGEGTARLQAIAPALALGLHRMAIRRSPHPADIFVLRTLSRILRAMDVDVLHGHGAKLGALIRLSRAASDALRVYTPHGGSLHYGPHTLKGQLYMRMERALIGRTDLMLFESEFARDTYQRVIGIPRFARCVYNGVATAEFAPVTPHADAADLVFVGELRDIKGPDLLLEAVAMLHRAGTPLTLTIAGTGPDADSLRAKAMASGIADAVRFIGYRPAREAFAKGRLLVVPSRGDSMPYVVLEAAAAGVPILAAAVGGIPEIFGPHSAGLFAANDPSAIVAAITAARADETSLATRTVALKERLEQRFSQAAMVDGIMSAYAEARNRRQNG